MNAAGARRGAMIGPKLVATSVKHVWAGAVIAIAVLVVAGCDLPGVEHTTLPASPTPAARPAGTRLPPATVTAGASRDASAAASRAAAPAERAVPTPSPVASPETTPLKRAATPAIPGWVAAGATRGAGAVATARAEATEAAAAATRIAIREEEEKKLPSLFSGSALVSSVLIRWPITRVMMVCGGPPMAPTSSSPTTGKSGQRHRMGPDCGGSRRPGARRSSRKRTLRPLPSVMRRRSTSHRMATRSSMPPAGIRRTGQGYH